MCGVFSSDSRITATEPLYLMRLRKHDPSKFLGQSCAVDSGTKHWSRPVQFNTSAMWANHCL